jgi:hypothetical protein
MVATGNVDIYLSPEGEKVGYFVPGQRFTPTGAEQNGWIQVIDSDGNRLWIQEGGPYGPAGEATPEVPPAVCEVPHWPDRTPDRKTGIVNFIGERLQIILPPGVENVDWVRFEDINLGAGIGWLRPTRITEIDRQNQIVTFDIGGGITVQRRIIPNTQIVMYVHEIYRGMPVSQGTQTGGTPCDLEKDDVAGIITLSQGEAVNPYSDLTDLWGVLIVQ